MQNHTSLKNMRRDIAAVLCASTFTSCVTTHVGNESKLQSHQLAVSCSPDLEVGSKRFALLICTFENTGYDWSEIEVESIEIKNTKVSTPEETRAFVEALANQRSKDKNNTDTALSALMIGGLVLAIVGGGHSSDVGLGVAGGAVVVGAGHDVRDSYRDVQYGTATYGADHMLGQQMHLPPGSFLRRSALLEMNKGVSVLGDNAEICFRQPKGECLEVQLVSLGRPR